VSAIFGEIKQKIASSSRQGVSSRNDGLKHLQVIAGEAKQSLRFGVVMLITDGVCFILTCEKRAVR